MISEQFKRTEGLIGREKMERLMRSSVLVVGIGGVGGYVCEALVRAGVGRIDVLDFDRVDITNLNRQIIALRDTVGRLKTQVMRERMLAINPELSCNCLDVFYTPEEGEKIDFGAYDYVADCVDNVTAKLDIISRAKAAGTRIISSMGTGNKLDPGAFEITDIEKTSVCPLARVMRRELKAAGIKNVKVLYSTEQPVNSGERTPASISFVPSAAGLMIAGEIIRDLMENEAGAESGGRVK